MTTDNLEVGDLVQLNPEGPFPVFAGCIMVVTDPKSWGAQGYIQALGAGNKPGGQAYLRVMHGDMVKVGKAHWVEE